MRSEKVFRAREQVANAYLLCRLAARTTCCLHFVSCSTRDAIEDAFTRIGQNGTGPALRQLQLAPSREREGAGPLTHATCRRRPSGS